MENSNDVLKGVLQVSVFQECDITTVCKCKC